MWRIKLLFKAQLSKVRSLEARSSTQEESQSYESSFTSAHEVTSSIRRLNSTKSEARKLKKLILRPDLTRPEAFLLHFKTPLFKVKSPEIHQTGSRLSFARTEASPPRDGYHRKLPRIHPGLDSRE